ALGQLAEGNAAPVAVERIVRAIGPGRITADPGDADEQIDVTHKLGEQHGIDLVERDRLARRGGETHLIRRQMLEAEALMVDRGLDRIDPEFDLEAALGEPLERSGIAPIPAAIGRAVPVARLTERAEAMLIDDVGCKAVRVSVRLAL